MNHGSFEAAETHIHGRQVVQGSEGAGGGVRLAVRRRRVHPGRDGGDEWVGRLQQDRLPVRLVALQRTKSSPYRQQSLQVIFVGVCITMKGLNTATESQFVWHLLH